MQVERCFSKADSDWLAMRQEIWPALSTDEHLADMKRQCKDRKRYAVFMARDDAGKGVAFMELSLRQEHVNGARVTPVAYVEGLFVQPEVRRQGVGRALVEAAERWAKYVRARMLASDADLANAVGHVFHEHAGFQETERVVLFSKAIDW